MVRVAVFFAGILFSISCTHRAVEPASAWTDETLFEYYISVVTTPPGDGLSGYEALSGKHVNLILSAVDFVEKSGKPRCENVVLSDQYFFVAQDNGLLKIQIEPSFTPDPENTSGVFPEPGGTQTFRSVPIEGARRVSGCFAQLRSSDGGSTFALVDK